METLEPSASKRVAGRRRRYEAGAGVLGAIAGASVGGIMAGPAGLAAGALVGAAAAGGEVAAGGGALVHAVAKSNRPTPSRTRG